MSKKGLIAAAIAGFLLGKRTGISISGDESDLEDFKDNIIKLKKITDRISVRREAPAPGYPGKKMKDIYNF